MRSLRLAHQFLRDEGIQWLPVDPFVIAVRHRWGPEQVGYIAKQLNIEYNQLLRGREADVIYCDGRYAIIYNERIISRTRIRWTLTHEMGHIVLGHLADFPSTALGCVVEREALHTLEREADIFAAETLAPMTVLTSLNVRTAAQIRKLCSISYEAALLREREVQLYGNGKFHQATRVSIQELFEDYIVTRMAIDRVRREVAVGMADR